MASDLRAFAARRQDTIRILIAHGSGARQPCTALFIFDWGCSRCIALARKHARTPIEKRRGNAETMPTARTLHAGIESPFAWLRLGAAAVLSTIGGVGTWSVPVMLPAVQVEFGVARADASLPFTLAMIGFACGGVLMGRLTDRFGIAAPVI